MGTRLLPWGLAVLALVAEAAAGAEPPRTDLYGDPLPAGAVARLGTRRLRLKCYCSVWFTKEDRGIVAADAHSTRLWDAQTGKELCSFKDESDYWKPALLPDGQTLLRASGEGVHLVSLETGKVQRQWPLRLERLDRLTPSPDGRLLLLEGKDSAEQSVLILWDVAAGKELRRWPRPRLFAPWAFTPDGKALISTLLDDSLQAQDVATRRERVYFHGHRRPVVALAFSADGKRAASRGYEEFVRVWDTAEGKELCHVQAGGRWGRALALSPNGQRLAVAGDDDVRLWNADTGREEHRLVHHDTVLSLAFSHDGRRLATAEDHSGIVRLWDVGTGKELLPFPNQQSWTYDLVFSPDRRRLWSVDGDALYCWEAATGKQLYRKTWQEERGAHHLALAPDGKALVAQGFGGVWWHEAATGKLLRHRALPEKVQFCRGLSADGQQADLWLKDDSGVIWETATGKRLYELPARQDASSAAFAADGQTLAYVFDRGIYLWSVREKRCLLRLPLPDDQQDQFSVGKLAISPRGDLLACSQGNTAGTRHTIYLWEIASGRLLRRLGPVPDYCWQALSFSPDGRLLAGAARIAPGQGTFGPILWSVETGERLATLGGHAEHLVYLAFSADGKQLATADNDYTTLLWDTEPVYHRLRRAAVPPTARELPALWGDLAADPPAAYAAIARLAAAPEQAVPFLRGRLEAATEKREPPVAKLIADLDAEAFAVRDSADSELARRGLIIEGALRKALADNLSLEGRLRIQRLLSRLQRERLRWRRVLLALEEMGTPEARQLLQELAADEHPFGLAAAARAALRRSPAGRTQGSR